MHFFVLKLLTAMSLHLKGNKNEWSNEEFGILNQRNNEGGSQDSGIYVKCNTTMLSNIRVIAMEPGPAPIQACPVPMKECAYLRAGRWGYIRPGYIAWF